MKKIKNYGALHGWITLILKVMDLLIYVFINYFFCVFEIIIVFLPPLFSILKPSNISPPCNFSNLSPFFINSYCISHKTYTHIYTQIFKNISMHKLFSLYNVSCVYVLRTVTYWSSTSGQPISVLFFGKGYFSSSQLSLVDLISFYRFEASAHKTSTLSKEP